ncbi:FtsX-like permease family protein [Actinoplanes awajinensis]|uniref:Permease n=1 Tax=Actinoplanes awajinensis subsp. mycoplanecinus TaxID=135947 RepID=A0A0X3V2I7_9ACTN|nr:FtsX-like permease family protein [Actinoplanes awajinensis]KUL38991.1 permease [Actinoplanes awajinensis subsp. mycoplanecinus]
MRAGTLVRLSLAGNRTDRLRTVLTAASSALAALALLAAATVAAIRGGNWVPDPASSEGGLMMAPGSEQYASTMLVESGLRPGVIFGLAMLALPVLALAGQCIRLGAPARDRRLAALRLAGATPGQAVLIAGAETTAASLLGSVLGLGLYLLLRVVLDARTPDGRLLLPTDVLPNPVLAGLLLLTVPVLSGAIGVLLIRRVLITPLGVVRRLRERGPRPWPGVLIVLGLVLLAPETFDLIPKGARLPAWTPLAMMGAGVLCVMVGVVLGTGWISYTTGRLLRRYGRGAVSLLTGARLMADPWNGSRTLGALLAAVVFGAGALGYRADLWAEFTAYDRFNALSPADGGTFGAAEDQSFYYNGVRLVLVAVAIALVVAAGGVLVAFAEGIVARRRTFAAMTASGVPRRTLGSMLLWHTFAPLVPALLLALVSGASLTRSLRTEVEVGGGSGYEACVDPAQDFTTCAKKIIVDPLVVQPVPVPFGQLALLGGGALLVMLLVVGAGMLVLRSSTDLEELRVG